jgi:2'-hydroxyisoflavone reductase
MKILLLGGTKFLGRALVEAALIKGHTLTLFHRGKQDPTAFPQVEHIIGDRDGDLELLAGKRWDAVIDTSGNVPRVVRESVELLKDQVNHYTYVSSISVYENLKQVNFNETAPIATIVDENSEAIGEHYGALKALCEKAVESAMPGRSLHIRPGLIVGPYDHSDRFTYWPHRIAKGGEVLVPSPKSRRLQFINVRDLAAWMIRLVEQKETGTIHASGRDYTMEQVIDTCAEVSGSKSTFTWVTESFLNDHQVGEWIDIPLWIKSDSLVGMLGADNAKAFAKGLTIRPLSETVKDTLLWDQSRPPSVQLKVGLEQVREQELLRLWHESN